MKKIMVVSIMLCLMLLVISSVGAADNQIDGVICTEKTINDDFSVSATDDVNDILSIEETNNQTNSVLNYCNDENNNLDDVDSANNLKSQDADQISVDDCSIMGSVNILDKTFTEKTFEINYTDSLEFKIDLNGISNTEYVVNVWTRDGDSDVDTRTVTSDNNGDVNFTIHLNPGRYAFEIYENREPIYNENWQGHDYIPHIRYDVNILPFYGSTNYVNMKIKGIQAIFGQDKYFYCQWDGLFKGYLKIYKGSKVLDNVYLDNFNHWDMSGYSEEYFVGGLPAGTLTAKVIDMDGKIITQSTIKILKTASKVKISSITAKSGSVKWIKANVYDKMDNGYHNGGKVKFNIIGKKYYAKVKDGTAKIKIKVPSKIKTYTCKATFLGDNNAKSSSKTFKISVKKATTKKTTTKKTASKKKKITKFTLTVPTKLNKKIIRYYGKYSVQTYKYYKSNGKKDITLKITVYKNGKRLSGFDAKYYVHYKSGGGVWLYTKNAKPKGYSHNYVGYTNVLKADWVKVTVWP